MNFIIKTLYMYVIVAIFYKLIGKKELRDFSTLDFITYIVLLEIYISNSRFEIMPIIILFIIQIIEKNRIKYVLDKIDYLKEQLKSKECIKEEPTPIIIDGIIEYETLKKIKKTPNWISKLLIKEDIKLDDVFYAIYTKDKTFIIKKSDLF